MKNVIITAIIFSVLTFFVSCKKDNSPLNNTTEQALIPYESLSKAKLITPSNPALKKNVKMSICIAVSMAHNDSKYLVTNQLIEDIATNLNATSTYPNVYDAYNYLKTLDKPGYQQELVTSFPNTEAGKQKWIKKIFASLNNNKLLLANINVQAENSSTYDIPVIIYGISINESGEGIINYATTLLPECIGLQPALGLSQINSISEFWKSTTKNSISNVIFLSVGKM